MTTTRSARPRTGEKIPRRLERNPRPLLSEEGARMKKSANRWRKWSCRFGENRYKEAQKDITTLSSWGFRAKIWSPLPQHKTSAHVHVCVLCTENQLEELSDLTEPESES